MGIFVTGLISSSAQNGAEELCPQNIPHGPKRDLRRAVQMETTLIWVRQVLPFMSTFC